MIVFVSLKKNYKETQDGLLYCMASFNFCLFRKTMTTTWSSKIFFKAVAVTSTKWHKVIRRVKKTHWTWWLPSTLSENSLRYLIRLHYTIITLLVFNFSFQRICQMVLVFHRMFVHFLLFHSENFASWEKIYQLLLYRLLLIFYQVQTQIHLSSATH